MSNKFKMYPSQRVFVTFQKEGLHRWPDAHKYPGIEFLANEHRHMFHFRVEIQEVASPRAQGDLRP